MHVEEAEAEPQLEIRSNIAAMVVRPFCALLHSFAAAARRYGLSTPEETVL